VFYGIIIAGVAGGTLMGLFGLNPIKALFWSAVFNGVAAVPLLLAIIRIARDHRTLGKWIVTRTAMVWLWLAFALMLLSSAGMVASWFLHT